MPSADEPQAPKGGAIDLGELLREHVDALADAVLERFRAGEGPAGAPDAATLR
ncbi:MAG: hypothetical protein JWR30_1669, partial [Conexibacter sp.]|nr:hypothetical protein [Conexibacter sp.]